MDLLRDTCIKRTEAFPPFVPCSIYPVLYPYLFLYTMVDLNSFCRAIFQWFAGHAAAAIPPAFYGGIHDFGHFVLWSSRPVLSAAGPFLLMRQLLMIPNKRCSASLSSVAMPGWFSWTASASGSFDSFEKSARSKKSFFGLTALLCHGTGWWWCGKKPCFHRGCNRIIFWEVLVQFYKYLLGNIPPHLPLLAIVKPRLYTMLL